MKTKNIIKSSFFLLFLMSVTITGCSKDEEQDAIVKVNGTALVDNEDDFVGDINGDFTGTGGSVSRTFLWQNSLTTAEYNADITTSAEGNFRMLVEDAEGTVVLDKSLSGSSGPDSFSGVTMSGVPGVWSVTIAVTSFEGDGSFSLSEGN